VPSLEPCSCAKGTNAQQSLTAETAATLALQRVPHKKRHARKTQALPNITFHTWIVGWSTVSLLLLIMLQTATESEHALIPQEKFSKAGQACILELPHAHSFMDFTVVGAS